MNELESSAIDEAEPTRLQPRVHARAAGAPSASTDDDDSTQERTAPRDLRADRAAATVVDDSGMAASLRAELDGPTPHDGWPAGAALPTLADGGFDVPPTLVDGAVAPRMRVAIADAITNTNPVSISGVLRPQPLQSVPAAEADVAPPAQAAESSYDYTLRPPIDITRAPTRRHRPPPAAVTDDAPLVVSERPDLDHEGDAGAGAEAPLPRAEAPTAPASATPPLPTLETRSIGEDPVMPPSSPVPLAARARPLEVAPVIAPAVTPIIGRDIAPAEPPRSPALPVGAVAAVPSAEVSSAALPPLATGVAWLPLGAEPDADEATRALPSSAPAAAPAPGARGRRVGGALLAAAALVAALATWFAR